MVEVSSTFKLIISLSIMLLMDHKYALAQMLIIFRIAFMAVALPGVSRIEQVDDRQLILMRFSPHSNGASYSARCSDVPSARMICARRCAKTSPWLENVVRTFSWPRFWLHPLYSSGDLHLLSSEQRQRLSEAVGVEIGQTGSREGVLENRTDRTGVAPILGVMRFHGR